MIHQGSRYRRKDGYTSRDPTRAAAPIVADSRAMPLAVEDRTTRTQITVDGALDAEVRRVVDGSVAGVGRGIPARRRRRGWRL